MHNKRILVIVSCSARKIWDKNPNMGPVKARDAYIGPLFRLAKRYAELSGCDWLILSAKYGFIEPDYVIPGNYNATFKDPRTNPISLDDLRRQVVEKKLYEYDKVIVLGSRHYSSIVRSVFREYNVEVEAPLEGLSIGKMLTKLKKMTENILPGSDYK